MRFDGTYNHHHAHEVWSKRGLYDWLIGVFDAPDIRIGRGCTEAIRLHVTNAFESNGWALDVPIDPALRNTVSALNDGLAFQVQTGNMSRAPYDLLKLQHLFQGKKIEGAAFAVPTHLAAKKIGSNIAYFERVRKEMKVFDRVITCPILVVAID